jgi:competence protein ComEA
VVAPSVYELERGSRVHEAIEAAGGFTEDADTDYLNQAAVLHDGDKLYVPAKEADRSDTSPSNTNGPSSDTAVSPSNTAGSSSNKDELPPDSTESIGDSSDTPTTSIAPDASDTQPVNINTADAETLQTLKDIGPITAQKIIDYRDKNGPYKKIEDIKKVDGIGKKTFENLKGHIRVR